jgi:ABC-type Fe3+ transport system permease subunit
VLDGFVVFAGAHWTAAAAAAAVALSALTLVVAAAGCTWRYVTAPLAPGSVRPTGQRPTGAVRIVLFGLAWLVVVVLASPWVVVPLAALSAARGVSPAHWAALVGGAPLVNTLLLGLGVAFMGTGLALAVASIAARRRGVLGASVTALARVPVAVPGVVGGIGYLLAFGAPEGDLVLVALLVAVWELPLMLRVAGNVLARADRSTELAALTLGADRLTMVRRVVLPGLRPAVAWLLCHGFAAGVAAVGTVVILAEQTGVKLGVLDMLHAASRGAVGAACAVATVLLVLAGGAMLLGRVVAGRESVPTLLA